MRKQSELSYRLCSLVVGATLLALTLAPAISSAQEDPPQEQTSVQAENSAFAIAPGARDGELDRGAITLEVFPGQIIEDTVSIFNFTDSPIDFRVWAGDGYNTADGAYAIFSEEVPTEDVGTWVELPTSDITVNPTSRADVPIRIIVPEDATPGDHAGGIAALNTSPVDSLSESGAEIDILRAVGTRIYIRVAGELIPELSIRNVEVDSSQPLLPLLMGRGDAVVEFDVVNTGNLRLASSAQVDVSGPFGIARTTLEPVAIREILPGSTIRIRQEVADVPALTRMTARVRLTPDAITDLGVTRTAAFWAIPWLYLVLLAIIVGGWWWYRRHRKDRENREYMEEHIDSEPEAVP